MTGLSSVLAVALCFSLPFNKASTFEQEFDLLEVYVQCNEYGGVTYTRLIAYDWNDFNREWQVQATKYLGSEMWDKTDDNHKEKWEAEREKFLLRFDRITEINELNLARNALQYPGKLNKQHALYPKKNHRSGFYEAWMEAHRMTLRIRAKLFRVRFSQGKNPVFLQSEKYLPSSKRGWKTDQYYRSLNRSNGIMPLWGWPE